MKKIYFFFLLSVVFLTACGKSDHTVAPAKKSVALIAHLQTSLPMADNVSQCGQPGVDSNSPMCDQAKDQHDVQVANPVNTLNDQLAKLGSLSVMSVNPEGYPVFEMECNARGQCVNGVGIPMGSVSDVVKQMTVVRQSDIQKYGWKCSQFCKDGQGNIIGRPE